MKQIVKLTSKITGKVYLDRTNEGVTIIPTKKETLRGRCERLSQEFSPLLAARVRAAKVRKIMTANTSFKFRLNQLVSMDARQGQVWPVPVSAPTIAWLVGQDMATK